jgi:hypothetical protein
VSRYCSHRTTNIRDIDSYKNLWTNERVGRIIKFIENFKIQAAIKTHLISILLLEVEVQQRLFNYPLYPREDESIRHLYKDHAYINDIRVEKRLARLNK